MTEEDRLTGCIQSFFRARHQKGLRYKKAKRNFAISLHRRNYHMVRFYILKLRKLRGEI